MSAPVQLRSPTGERIVSTVETIPGTTAIVGFYRDEAGDLVPDYDSIIGTEVCWDAQETVTDAFGSMMVQDEGGQQWPLSDCIEITESKPWDGRSSTLRNEQALGDVEYGRQLCEQGIHSWVDEVGKLPADTACTRCGELYGDPS